ncbi:hypothetical protein SEA_ATUIN_115 [Arthrobacter phage Atuin]|nr:hypothetical protein SEA_ATUIN_214 [Arthrobacter phage Atuin]
MALETNKVSKDPLFMNQGARPTERDENDRIETVNQTTGEAQVTENTENKRIGTVVY